MKHLINVLIVIGLTLMCIRVGTDLTGLSDQTYSFTADDLLCVVNVERGLASMSCLKE